MVLCLANRYISKPSIKCSLLFHWSTIKLISYTFSVYKWLMKSSVDTLCLNISNKMAENSIKQGISIFTPFCLNAENCDY